MPAQIDHRAKMFVAFYQIVKEHPGGLSAYAVGKVLGYRPTHAHRWARGLLGVGLVRRRAGKLVAVPLGEIEAAKRIAKCAARSLVGRRRVKHLDVVNAEVTVGNILRLQLYDKPMTRF